MSGNKKNDYSESLIDGKNRLCTRTKKVISLADIAIYMILKVLEKCFATLLEKVKGKSLDSKVSSTDELKKHFGQQFLPNYDRDRVHNSDIKKYMPE